ncbi:MAG: TorF family putative porin [Methylococcales bacterium]
MKKIVLAALLVISSIGASYAQVTGNISVTSDYRFRGISQTANSQALQGGIDYVNKSGFYAGNWNSSVSSALYTDSIGMENDVYAGFKKEVVKGVTIDVGSYNYYYSRSGNTFNSVSNTHEVYIGGATGPISVKYSQSLGDYFATANSKGSKYYQADLNMPMDKKLTLNAHVGRTSVANHSASNYTDVKFGATYAVAGLDVGAHYYTNRGLTAAAKTADTVAGEKLYKSAIVFSVAKAF